jgi:hypothetical protein
MKIKFTLKKLGDTDYYLLSDEKIFGEGFRFDLQRNSVGFIDDDNYYNNYPNDFKKIIASTNHLQNTSMIDFLNLFDVFDNKPLEAKKCSWTVIAETDVNNKIKITDGYVKILSIEND